MERPQVYHVYLWRFCTVHSAKCDKLTFTACPNAWLQSAPPDRCASYFFIFLLHVFLVPLSPFYLQEDPSLRQGIVSDEQRFTGSQSCFSIDECPFLPAHNSYTLLYLQLQHTFTCFNTNLTKQYCCLVCKLCFMYLQVRNNKHILVYMVVSYVCRVLPKTYIHTSLLFPCRTIRLISQNQQTLISSSLYFFLILCHYSGVFGNLQLERNNYEIYVWFLVIDQNPTQWHLTYVLLLE